ncbi:MAG: ImmA/IrrE family metallo-endopeptidase, partial [Deltaproteobacteria bacterium]|nr:ImmA/IrrE family metallo-endopeptidase [Deltaproteobacteria bacterium]
YEGACAGEGRDRFTMCHELGHLLMHRGVALSRIDPDNPPKIYRNSEWQADTFASYLMMPKDLIADSSYHRVTAEFGVSLEAAWARRDDMKKA